MQIKLNQLNKKIKLLLSSYLIVLGIGVTTGLVYIYLTTSMTPSGTVEQYIGTEDEWEPKHPQLEVARKTVDAEAIRDARPDIQFGEDFLAFVVYTNAGLGIVGTEMETFEVTASLGTVTVSIT